MEEGTTTPFDMVMRNDLDRFHLASDVIDRTHKLAYLKSGNGTGLRRPVFSLESEHRRDPNAGHSA